MHEKNNNSVLDIDNLIDSQKTSAYDQQLEIEAEENELAITKVVTAKYKVYVVLLIIVAAYLFYSVYPTVSRNYDNANNTYVAKTNELAQKTSEVERLTKERLKLVSSKKAADTVIECINNSTMCRNDPNNEDFPCDKLTTDAHDGICDAIPAELSWDIKTIVSYLQLGALSSEKMGIDEEKVLKNLDWYLIKNHPDQEISTPNGVIESINIGEEEHVKWNNGKWLGAKDNNGLEEHGLHMVPITISISFTDKDDLITFVDNIEQYIIPAEDDRILYQIVEVSYDMMAYDEKQSTEISLIAYYFN